MSNEAIKDPDNTIAPELIYYGKKMRAKLNGNCWKEDKITFNHGKIVSIYNVYVLKPTLIYNEDITLKNCFFGAVILTKNDDISEYKYSGYAIGFDEEEAF